MARIRRETVGEHASGRARPYDDVVEYVIAVVCRLHRFLPCASTVGRSAPDGGRLSPGQRRQLIPRNIINSFACTYNGEEIFRADFYPPMAANPFVAFTTVATESGALAFTWTSDGGEMRTESRPITGNERARAPPAILSECALPHTTCEHCRLELQCHSDVAAAENHARR
jgi:hypothetical protein